MRSDEIRVKTLSGFLLFAAFGAPLAGAGACEPKIDVQYQKIADQPQVMFGELQGTNESPAFFGSIVCLASRKHKLVTMAVEWPSDMQADVEKYLKSPSFERGQMVRNWGGGLDSKDGRSSQAMLEMLGDLAEEINKGRVRLVLMDKPIMVRPAGKFAGLTRDKYMWEKVSEELTRHPAQQALILVGNFHSMRLNNPDGTQRLGQLADRFLILDMQYSSGTAWVCMENCGSHEVVGSEGGVLGAIGIDHASAIVDGTFQVGHVSYSSPVAQ